MFFSPLFSVRVYVRFECSRFCFFAREFTLNDKSSKNLFALLFISVFESRLDLQLMIACEQPLGFHAN